MIGACFLGLCIISIIFAFISGDVSALTNAVIDGAAKSVTLTFNLVGMMCLWCGIMRVFTECGIMEKFTQFMAPVLKFVFPNAWKTGVAKNEITAAVCANILGIGNAATPYAIKAMEQMDAANPDPETATDDMATLAVLGSSSIDLIPTTLITLRRSAGSLYPYKIIIPVWICSIVCAVCGVILSRLMSKTRQSRVKSGIL